MEIGWRELRWLLVVRCRYGGGLGFCRSFSGLLGLVVVDGSCFTSSRVNLLGGDG